MSLRACLVVVALLATACIERPQTARGKAAQVDRTKLTDVLYALAPTPQVPVGAVFGDAIELVGYDLDPAKPAAGQPVKVTYWWRAVGTVDDDWQVFVHLEDETDANPRRLADHFPADKRFPTSAWREGDVIKDEWSFTLPKNPGRIQLWTGLYIAQQRLDLSRAGRGRSDSANRVRAGVVVVP